MAHTIRSVSITEEELKWVQEQGLSLSKILQDAIEKKRKR